MMMKRRKLLSFTDTRSEIAKRKNQFQKKGYKDLIVKSEYNGYSLLGKKINKKK